MGDPARQITTDGTSAALLDAAGTILIGPIDIDATVERARLLLEGRPDHHSVTALINELALALVAGAGRG
ncbi:MAG: hypothetical protein RLZZ501_2190 [Pseudomonadota bacterium]|jgi:hypothetical protein